MRSRIVAGLIMLLAAPSAAAAEQLAQVSDQAPVAAHDGWVVWSVKRDGAFRLVAWRDGVTREAAAPPRQEPFDVDLGTDANGRDVVTFSRCSSTRTITVNEARRRVGTACRLRVLDLATGSERPIPVPRAAGTSDSMPSMWNGRVAFARRDPRRHGNVDQVLLWGPGSGVRALRHGAMPSSCPYRNRRDCVRRLSSGEVTGLDLGADLVAFAWRIQAPGVIGHGGYEIRADRVSDDRSALVGSGYIGEACTEGVDGTTPATPTVQGGRVWYSQTATACYHVGATLQRYGAFPVRGSRGPLDGIVLQAVKDGAALYELVAPPNGPDQPPSCTPCTIDRVALPALSPIGLAPHSPLF